MVVTIRYSYIYVNILEKGKESRNQLIELKNNEVNTGETTIQNTEKNFGSRSEITDI